MKRMSIRVLLLIISFVCLITAISSDAFAYYSETPMLRGENVITDKNGNNTFIGYPPINLGNNFSAYIRQSFTGKYLSEIDNNISLSDEIYNNAVVWNFTKNSDGSYSVCNNNSKKYFEVSGINYVIGDKVSLSYKTNLNSQKFYFYYINESFYIKCFSSDKLLEINSSNNLQLCENSVGTTETEKSARSFEILKINLDNGDWYCNFGESGNVYIRNVASGLLMTANGYDVSFKEATYGDNQKWKISLKADGSYEIISVGSGNLYLDVENQNINDGTPVNLYEKTGSKNQSFYFLPTDEEGYHVIKPSYTNNVLDMDANSKELNIYPPSLDVEIPRKAEIFEIVFENICENTISPEFLGNKFEAYLTVEYQNLTITDIGDGTVKARKNKYGSPQLFKFKYDDTYSAYEIIGNSGNALEVSNSEFADASVLGTNVPNGKANQRFRLYKDGKFYSISPTHTNRLLDVCNVDNETLQLYGTGITNVRKFKLYMKGEVIPEVNNLVLKSRSDYWLYNSMLYFVKEKETVSQLIENFDNIFIDVKDSLGNSMGANATVGTGCTVMLMKNGAVSDCTTVIVKGDITGEGTVDSTDYLRIKSAFLDTIELTAEFSFAADVDESGKLDSTDYLKIKNHFLGLHTLNEKKPVSDEVYYENFRPVLRFAVASDLHIDDYGTEIEENRLEKLLNYMLKYSNESDTYSDFDGFLVAGDLVDNGTASSMEKVQSIVNSVLKGDTVQFFSVGNHEFYTDSPSTLQRFSEAFDCPVDDHIVINGYHFIKLSPDLNNGWAFSEEKQKWLDSELKKANNDTPNKPIFVMQHEHVEGTVYGSVNSWGIPDLKAILSKYPNVVDFSGHSHYPIVDPRSIHQEIFTSIGTGTLSFTGFSMNGYETGEWAVDYFAAGYNGEITTSWKNGRDMGQFQIVEVDEKGAIVIIGYDIDSEKELFRRYVRCPGDSSTYKYTNARIEASQKPYFETDSLFNVHNVSSEGFQVEFAQAKCDDTVESYRVEVSKDGKIICTNYLTSLYYYLDAPQTLRNSIGGLTPNTTYTLNIYPVNAFGKVGTPLSTTVKTLAEGAVRELSPDVFSFEARNDGAYNAITGEKLNEYGNPTVYYDENQGKYISSFDGESAYMFSGIEEFYGMLTESITFETYFSMDAFASDYSNVFSNQQSAGIGIDVGSSGSLDMYVNVDGEYKKVSVSIETNKFYHLIATYDGINLKLYIDGKLVGTTSANGAIKWPWEAEARKLVVGGDSAIWGGAEYMMKGKISVANIYSTVLTSAEVQNVYSSLD